MEYGYSLIFDFHGIEEWDELFEKLEEIAEQYGCEDFGYIDGNEEGEYHIDGYGNCSSAEEYDELRAKITAPLSKVRFECETSLELEAGDFFTVAEYVYKGNGEVITVKEK